MGEAVLVQQVRRAWQELVALGGEGHDHDVAFNTFFRYDLFKLSERISLALAADDQAELSACLHECRHLITRTEMVRRMAQPQGEAPDEG